MTRAPQIRGQLDIQQSSAESQYTNHRALVGVTSTAEQWHPYTTL